MAGGFRQLGENEPSRHPMIDHQLLPDRLVTE
jgi:hypothetical protein